MLSLINIDIKRYESKDKAIWDQFVSESKNGTFLIYRGFMEYHSARFRDHSLLFYLKNRLIAILPANITDTILYSHQGLTYGGLIVSTYVKTIHVLAIFEKLKAYLKDYGICKLIYKVIPHIYHKQPSEEDLYALYRNRAKLVGRNISSAIEYDHQIEYSTLRLRGIKKAQSKHLMIKESHNFESFWRVLEENLKQKHASQPTHSLSEIEYLYSKFPENIKLFEIGDGKDILAGCTIFETYTTSHLQYISASTKGKATGALDLLLSNIILLCRNNSRWFDFGISTEENGDYLNEGLINQKEGFGARAVVYDIYELDL